jgi:hypothetical protein
MTKTEAVKQLLREQRATRSTNTGAKRVLKACKVLGVEEPITILCWMDFCDIDGNPYSPRIERIW